MHNVYETLRDFYERECKEEDIDMALMFGHVISVVRLSCKNATGSTSTIIIGIDAVENVKEFLLDELEDALLKLKEHRKEQNKEENSEK